MNGDYGSTPGKLATTGITVTVGSAQFGIPLLLAVGIGLTAIGAAATRLGFRRSKSVGDR